jgi:glycosyltransferase involved in cell wall biosynthesis
MITVMIFTLNEETHLPSCLASLRPFDDIVVVDSFSKDRTADICRAAGVRFYQRQFDGFGSQRNWALENCEPLNEWILILDADERVPAGLAQELLTRAATAPKSVGAFRVRRRFYMWGRWLRYSSLYPSWVVRFVRKGMIRYENRGHAETQVVDGEIWDLNNDLIDENLKGIDEWFERQNRYSAKEAAHEIETELRRSPFLQLMSSDPLTRRAALKQLGARLPARGFVYFLYSYLIRGGFLDGKDGRVFCMMRATYQDMIVAKKHDIKKRRILQK